MSRYEPPTVVQLRAQIARGGSPSLLHRIAGSAAEYERLASAYGLAKTSSPAPIAPVPRAAPPPPVPVKRDRRSEDPLPARQTLLLGMLTHLAQIGEVFPGAIPLGTALECSWLVIERDLRHLERKGLIRVLVMRDPQQRTCRCVEISGSKLKTALPAAFMGLVAAVVDEANGVRQEA